MHLLVTQSREENLFCPRWSMPSANSGIHLFRLEVSILWHIFNANIPGSESIKKHILQGGTSECVQMDSGTRYWPLVYSWIYPIWTLKSGLKFFSNLVLKLAEIFKKWIWNGGVQDTADKASTVSQTLLRSYKNFLSWRLAVFWQCWCHISRVSCCTDGISALSETMPELSEMKWY
jgi:hypothetical protein